MTVKSNEIRTIKIEGVDFTPAIKGVDVPADKEASLKQNFFFNHYLSIGAFIIVEEKAQSKAQIKDK